MGGDDPHFDMQDYLINWNAGPFGLVLRPDLGPDMPPCVAALLPEQSVAKLSGVQPGDMLISVNGKKTTKLGYEKVVKMLYKESLPVILHFRTPKATRQAPQPSLPMPQSSRSVTDTQLYADDASRSTRQRAHSASSHHSNRPHTRQQQQHPPPQDFDTRSITSSSSRAAPRSDRGGGGSSSDKERKQFTAVWEAGSLGLSFRPYSARVNVPCVDFISALRGRGRNMDRVCVNDVLIAVNGEKTKALGVDRVLRWLLVIEKPVVLRFHSSSNRVEAPPPAEHYQPEREPRESGALAAPQPPRLQILYEPPPPPQQRERRVTTTTTPTTPEPLRAYEFNGNGAAGRLDDVRPLPHQQQQKHQQPMRERRYSNAPSAVPIPSLYRSTSTGSASTQQRDDLSHDDAVLIVARASNKPITECMFGGTPVLAIREGSVQAKLLLTFARACLANEAEHDNAAGAASNERLRRDSRQTRTYSTASNDVATGDFTRDVHAPVAATSQSQSQQRQMQHHYHQQLQQQQCYTTNNARVRHDVQQFRAFPTDPSNEQQRTRAASSDAAAITTAPVLLQPPLSVSSSFRTPSSQQHERHVVAVVPPPPPAHAPPPAETLEEAEARTASEHDAVLSSESLQPPPPPPSTASSDMISLSDFVVQHDGHVADRSTTNSSGQSQSQSQSNDTNDDDDDDELVAVGSHLIAPTVLRQQQQQQQQQLDADDDDAAATANNSSSSDDTRPLNDHSNIDTMTTAATATTTAPTDDKELPTIASSDATTPLYRLDDALLRRMDINIVQPPTNTNAVAPAAHERQRFDMIALTDLTSFVSSTNGVPEAETITPTDVAMRRYDPLQREIDAMTHVERTSLLHPLIAEMYGFLPDLHNVVKDKPVDSLLMKKGMVDEIQDILESLQMEAQFERHSHVGVGTLPHHQYRIDHDGVSSSASSVSATGSNAPAAAVAQAPLSTSRQCCYQCGKASALVDVAQTDTRRERYCQDCYEVLFHSDDRFADDNDDAATPRSLRDSTDTDDAFKYSFHDSAVSRSDMMIGNGGMWRYHNNGDSNLSSRDSTTTIGSSITDRGDEVWL